MFCFLFPAFLFSSQTTQLIPRIDVYLIGVKLTFIVVSGEHGVSVTNVQLPGVNALKLLLALTLWTHKLKGLSVAILYGQA